MVKQADIIKDDAPDMVVLRFADSKVPKFKEARGKDYILYGDDNLYPEYLTELYNKSAKHNAILTGKGNYIFGEGFEDGNTTINRLGESLNDISRRAILDIEIYGGFRFEVIYNTLGKICEIYHVDYTSIRVGKEGGFWYKESWADKYKRDEVFIPEFDASKPEGTQIYAYNEYRPMVRFYPLPGYIGANNYIEVDIEVSKYYLSSIRNGMMPSKMIQFYQGEPTEDKKRIIENRFANKFAGAENAGKFLLVFGNDKNKSVDISDLSGGDLDKMFIELNKTAQQEIFSGHLITSPMLFGIKTEGQLGGNAELRMAYEIFINTYAKLKAKTFEKEIQYLFSYSTYPGTYELQQTDPIGWAIPDELLKQAITVDEVRLRLGLPIVEKIADSDATKTINALTSVSPLVATKILDNLTKNEIRALAALPPLPEGNIIPGDISQPNEPVLESTLDSDIKVNDNIKNLSAKQYQHVARVIREYSKGKLAPEAARLMLRAGLGLSEEDINTLLGIESPAFSEQTEDDIIAVFDEYGDSKNDYTIVKNKTVSFSLHDAKEDEEVYIAEAFASVYDVTYTEQKILDMIRGDKRITPELIANAIGESRKFVTSKINELAKKGYLESVVTTIGSDEIIERTIPKGADIKTPPAKKDAVKISIKYSYEPKVGEQPIIATSRPFCIKLIKLNRLYSRVEIEKISDRLGYSVFDRKGGWWGKSPECRHRWVSNILIQKKGA